MSYLQFVQLKDFGKEVIYMSYLQYQQQKDLVK